MKALNAYFQMPFSTAAKFTLTNEGKTRTDNLYFAVDYVTFPSLPSDVGRFHAQYRQAAQTRAGPTTGRTIGMNPVGDKKNLDGVEITSSWRLRARGILSE